MSINTTIKDYTFTVKPEHFGPLLKEPIVQTAAQVLAYLGAALAAFKQLLDLWRALRLSEIMLAVMAAYATTNNS